MRKIVVLLAMCTPVAVLVAELGTNNPTDQAIQQLRATEATTPSSCDVGPPYCGTGGVFDIATPPAGTVYHPAGRVPRNTFGVVSHFPLTQPDLNSLVFPDATDAEKSAMAEGLDFFTRAHPSSEGAGPMANQPFCLGCHMSTNDLTPAITGPGFLTNGCTPGSTCVSLVSRAARSTPTNFNPNTRGTALDPSTGGGRAPGSVDSNGIPNPDDVIVPFSVNGPGHTAAFTTFGDFTPIVNDVQQGAIGFFDPLDGSVLTVPDKDNKTTTRQSQPFGGFVQHVRPSPGLPTCIPKPLPPVQADALLQGPRDPVNGLDTKTGFRRSVGERAGPPYIGRGLIEAVPNKDIVDADDQSDARGSNSSLGQFATQMGCTGDCVAGKANIIPRTYNAGTGRGFVGGVGRFGLRANGSEIIQFVIGGARGELSFTSLLDRREINFPTLFPMNAPPSLEPSGCFALATSTVYPAALQDTPDAKLELHLSSPFSERNMIRNVAPPEFGDTLLALLQQPNPAGSVPANLAQVQRGAQLFGIDLVAFANRMIDGRMPAAGDGLDPHAINQADRMVGCVSCHTPVQRTGQSPAAKTASQFIVGGEHLSYVWAPIFSDLLIHKMPVVNVERLSPRPRDPWSIARQGTSGIVPSFDISRNLADDTFSDQKAAADGREFRTAPLMGIGRIGPPFMHDARVYLSSLTVNSAPASTVTTNSTVTNAPLVIQTADDALLAVIEMHDLPAPDDGHTSSAAGGGCPVPANGATNISYGVGATGSLAVCPPYNNSVSRKNRSDSREVIRRFRSLSPADQQAIIAFLKQL